MKKAIVTIIICLCIFVCFIAIIQAVVRIKHAYGSEIECLDTAIDSLMSDLNSMKDDRVLDRQGFIERIDRFSVETEQVILTVLYNRESGYEYVNPINSPFLLERPDSSDLWNGFPMLAKDTFTDKLRSVDFNDLGFRDLVLSMIVRAPKQSEIIIIFRDSILLVLASIIICLGGLIYSSQHVESSAEPGYISLAQLTKRMGVYETMPTYIQQILKNSITITIITNIVSIPVMFYIPHVLDGIGIVSSSGFFLWFTADAMNFLLRCSRYISGLLLVLNIFSLALIVMVMIISLGTTKPVNTSVHMLAKIAAFPSGITIISVAITVALFIAIIALAFSIWFILIMVILFIIAYSD